MADKHPAYSPANRPDTQEPEQLLREFHTVYNVPEGEDLSLYPGELPQLPARRRFTLRKAILTAAAAACLILLLVCTTVGFDTVFQMIGVWTPEQLTFENQYDGEISDMEPTPTQPEEDAATPRCRRPSPPTGSPLRWCRRIFPRASPIPSCMSAPRSWIASPSPPFTKRATTGW